MATRTLLALLSFPFFTFSRIAEAINLWDIRKDVANCVRHVDKSTRHFSVPKELIQSLVVAEDRRNAMHCGVDPIGILRAALSIITKNGLQGASTIEQQFVRVVSDSYERTLHRKIREQALAIAVSRRRSKVDISTAYLCMAYYGYGLAGKTGLKILCGRDLYACSSPQIYETIARIKYPQPIHASEIWRRKLEYRSSYIANRLLHISARSPKVAAPNTLFPISLAFQSLKGSMQIQYPSLVAFIIGVLLFAQNLEAAT